MFWENVWKKFLDKSCDGRTNSINWHVQSQNNLTENPRNAYIT